MKRSLLAVPLALAACSQLPAAPGPDMAVDLAAPPEDLAVLDLLPPPPISDPTCADWPQTGQNAAHTGVTCATGQTAARALSDLVFDPFTVAERSANMGEITAHYQAPLVVGDDVYMEQKGGTFDPSNLDTQRWSEIRLHWSGAALEQVWAYPTDWRPIPLTPWEQVFQPVIAGDAIAVPGLGGTVDLVDRRTGIRRARVNPFGGAIDPTTYVAGALSADAAGAVYYTAIQLGTDPLSPASWLVRVAPDGTSTLVPFATLVPDAPAASDFCQQGYPIDTPLPWPPAAGDGGIPAPPSDVCGAQRAALNAAPAIAPDGTLFVVSVAHNNERYGYVIAVAPDLTPRWSTSLRGYLQDGCGVLVPRDDDPDHCSSGAPLGVDPETDDLPAGMVDDSSSGSPVALPDGGVLYGALTLYNGFRGHLLKLDAGGAIVASYDFGWDTTPAVLPHDGTYSILLKDNHYENDLGPYYITRLDASLKVEWQFQSTNTMSCTRDMGGNLTCKDDHPHGFEWCVNSIAVDATGVVYANSEDGRLYALAADGTEREHLFLNLALGAAYTPLAIGRTGLAYTLNDGHLTAVGK